MERRQIHKVIVGALRETIRVHGPINRLLIGSAAKRIVGTLFSTKVNKNNPNKNDEEIRL